MTFPITVSEHAYFAGGIHHLWTIVEPYIYRNHTHGDGSLALDHSLGHGVVFRRGAGYDQQGIMKFQCFIDPYSFHQPGMEVIAQLMGCVEGRVGDGTGPENHDGNALRVSIRLIGPNRILPLQCSGQQLGYEWRAVDHQEHDGDHRYPACPPGILLPKKPS